MVDRNQPDSRWPPRWRPSQGDQCPPVDLPAGLRRSRARRRRPFRPRPPPRQPPDLGPTSRGHTPGPRDRGLNPDGPPRGGPASPFLASAPWSRDGRRGPGGGRDHHSAAAAHRPPSRGTPGNRASRARSALRPGCGWHHPPPAPARRWARPPPGQVPAPPAGPGSRPCRRCRRQPTPTVTVDAIPARCRSRSVPPSDLDGLANRARAGPTAALWAPGTPPTWRGLGLADTIESTRRRPLTGADAPSLLVGICGRRAPPVHPPRSAGTGGRPPAAPSGSG